MLLHTRKGHVEPVCQLRDRSIRHPELLHDAASRRVGERRKGDVEAGCRKLNHTV